MSSHEQQFKHTLKAKGLSITKSRLELFAALQKDESHTMHELVARCPGMDRVTIYRNVELFEALGIVQRLRIGWKYRLELTDDYLHHHHHLSCTNCGKIVAIAEDLTLERQLDALAAIAGFSATDHQVEIRGLCADCR
jgi:Fe2+ or Zn2+ uptake regulation protein